MKNKIINNIIKYVISFGLMAYLLYLSYDAIDESSLEEGQSKFDFIADIWASSEKSFFVLSGLFAVLSHLIRAARWRTVLKPLGFNNLNLNNVFQAVINGYFVNLVIPRGGEVSRAIALNKLEKVPVDVGIGTIIIERIIDLIFLIICIAIVFLFQFTLFYDFFNNLIQHTPVLVQEVDEYKYLKVGVLILFFVLSAIVGLFLYKRHRKKIYRLAIKVKLFLKGMKSGIMAVFQLKQRTLFIVYSFLIWVCYYMMLYMVFLAFAETKELTALDALTIFVVGGIAMALPLPGGTGSYHFLIPKALVTLCGLESMSKGVAFATIFHGWQTLILIVLGSIGLIYIYNKSQKKDVEQQ